jgi:hypothetical protein
VGVGLALYFGLAVPSPRPLPAAAVFYHPALQKVGYYIRPRFRVDGLADDRSDYQVYLGVQNLSGRWFAYGPYSKASKWQVPSRPLHLGRRGHRDLGQPYTVDVLLATPNGIHPLVQASKTDGLARLPSGVLKLTLTGSASYDRIK